MKGGTNFGMFRKRTANVSPQVGLSAQLLQALCHRNSCNVEPNDVGLYVGRSSSKVS